MNDFLKNDGDQAPDSDMVRGRYIDGKHYQAQFHGTIDPSNAGEEFDRWLKKVCSEAKAEALNELADQMRDKYTAIWVRRIAREILQGPTQYGGVFGLDQKKEDSNADQDL